MKLGVLKVGQAQISWFIMGWAKNGSIQLKNL